MGLLVRDGGSRHLVSTWRAEVGWAGGKVDIAWLIKGRPWPSPHRAFNFIDISLMLCIFSSTDLFFNILLKRLLKQESGSAD